VSKATAGGLFLNLIPELVPRARTQTKNYDTSGERRNFFPSSIRQPATLVLTTHKRGEKRLCCVVHDECPKELEEVEAGFKGRTDELFPS
jgi:hypothetical protein